MSLCEIQFILGTPGTGKTMFILREIRERISTGEKNLYYLVPEQFSLQSERLLLDDTGPPIEVCYANSNHPPKRGDCDTSEAERINWYRNSFEAATQVQVLSFNRLAHRLFSVLGAPKGKHADDLGKQMLLRKVLFETSGELEFFQSVTDKHGFVEELSHTITEMNHYSVSPGDLTARAAHSSPMFAAKLRDTALLLEKYREAVSGRYLLTDETLELLCKKLAQLDKPPQLLDGAFFWVDGFSGFTPQERQVLLHIMKFADKVTFSLTIEDSEVLIFDAPKSTLKKLEKLASQAHAKILPHIYMKENFRHVNAKGLAFYAKNDSGTHDDSESIEIVSATDRYAAVYAAAHCISRLMDENKWKFRDIAILCGDRKHYEKILQTVFDRLKIPLFVDTEIEILSHPLTEMIRAALDIFVRNWNYESVFRFLKTRLTGTPADTIDILENYALANGISSYRWKYSFPNENAECGRNNLLNALSPFENIRADSVDTVENFSRRVFDMLYALNIPDILQEWFEKHMRDGDPATARLHAQIWPKLCEVFDKLVEILGDEKVTLKTFAATLDAGLSQVGLGRIPPTVDQIVLGDITRSRYPQIKAMIVLGANDGVLPPVPVQSGLFSDFERKALRNSALELAPENFRKITEQNYNLYCTLSQPAEKLIFIYAESEPNGKPLRVSPIVTKFRKTFPNIKTMPAPIPVENAAQTSIFFAPITLQKATQPQTIYTAATRLENFARCPFAYFMHYTLGARPRKLYEVMPADLGKLFHDVIADFSKNPEHFTFSRERINEKVNSLVDALELEDSVFHSSSRNKHILEKVRCVAAASCWALSEQLKNDDFRPKMVEQEILANIFLENGKNLALSGRADRIDTFGEGGMDFYKIIDYKSGNAKFSMEEALQGVQLQLMLYMNAITNSRKNAVPGGVFYFPIDDPIINADDVLSEAAREEALLKCFKMSGIEVGDSAKNIDLATFKKFGQDVENKVKELGTRIANGDITAKPFTSGAKSPCKYCKFSGVCMHDRV
ncbi:MAG: exodeoxyribonuclease V subunit gamma [Defluviitaleaceae bacterium]|nr:exodeoxyribonuclease V subunit gamma [Defluviitaleaceae bacterium]